MSENSFDLIFLGGGPAGYQGAIRASQLGLRAAVIESRDLGGVCLNQWFLVDVQHSRGLLKLQTFSRCG